MVSDSQNLSAQRGLALIVSLVLLVVSSLLAIATLSGTRLSERIASNTQQKAIAFEAAESAVVKGYVRDEVLGVLPASSTQIDSSEAIEIGLIKSSLIGDFDQSQPGPSGVPVQSVDIDGTLTIQYCGETVLPQGTDLNANLDDSTRKVGMMFDVNGIATVAGNATRADHVQRGYVAGPATGRSGSCVTR